MRRSWRSWRSAQNRATVRLTTAAAINAGDLADIKKKLEALTGKQVDIDAQVDASLIGGAKAQIGSTSTTGPSRTSSTRCASIDELKNRNGNRIALLRVHCFECLSR